MVFLGLISAIHARRPTPLSLPSIWGHLAQGHPGWMNLKKWHLLNIPRKGFLKVTVEMPPCKLWQIEPATGKLGAASDSFLYVSNFLASQSVQDKEELTVEWGKQTNNSELRVKHPKRGAGGDTQGEQQSRGSRACCSRAELAALTKLTLSRPSAALLSNVHQAIAGKSLLILIGGTHL